MELEVENAASHVTHSSRGGWLDKILPVSALFVSFLSILLAWGNGEAMQDLVNQNKRLVQANSLPYLQLYSNSGPNNFDLVISNDGIGPGEIRTAEMLVDGRPVPDILSFLKACCGRNDRLSVGKSNVMGGMLRAGQQLHYIRISGDDPELLDTISKAYAERRFETRICYCSVFDECWQRSSRDLADVVRPKPVKSCQMPQIPYRS